MITTKKLIEVALPLEAINKESAHRKRKAPAGYPTMLHKWWAQRPVAAARAVLFAQMVDDPSSHPDIFRTEKAQDKERKRLFKIIEDLVLWDNTSNEKVLDLARAEIWQSWRAACAKYADHPRARLLFDRHRLPGFHDPFAGSGALPLEAQRLGLDTLATDLNPVAVLINQATLEIPPRFAGRPPVNPDWQKKSSHEKALMKWSGGQGLADDLRYYGSWMYDEAKRCIGALYPTIKVTSEMVLERPDLKPLLGKSLSVTACLWARTVKSPNPAYATVDVPLATTFMLSTKVGKEVYVEPIVTNDGYRFAVKLGTPPEGANTGTKLSRGANFRCVMSRDPIEPQHIKTEAMGGRMGARMMAIVAEGERRRIYLAPSREMEDVAKAAVPAWTPEGAFVEDARAFTPCIYGLTEWRQLFTQRQLVALTTFADLIPKVREAVLRDAIAAGVATDRTPLALGGNGAHAYADAVAVYLAMVNSRLADYGSTLATWRPKDNAMRSSLPKQALQMSWDFAEGSPFGKSSSGFAECVEVVAKVIARLPGNAPGSVKQSSAGGGSERAGEWIISTDPPYYDNVPYADLSDFFYVWLRRALKPILPELFATLAAPKTEELVAFAYRHDSEASAEAFFLRGMTEAMHRLAESAHPAFPVTIYYAFKQSETDADNGTASTGWETFLGAVVAAGLGITGTWPMRTESDNRQRGVGANALASSIILVCRPRPLDAGVVTRREFIAALKQELPRAVSHLQRGNIAPVDLQQAAIGPGMAVYTRYARVLDADGKQVDVHEALILINQILSEVLTKQEGDFDSDTRWAITWFEEHGFDDGEFGRAEQLTKSKNTSVAGLVEAGLVKSGRGKVRLLKPSELPSDWDPGKDERLTVWEMVHHLVRLLESGGEESAAMLVNRLGANAEIARELAYRLYSVCDHKNRASLAGSYNGLVQSWPELSRLARDPGPPSTPQTDLFAPK